MSSLEYFLDQRLVQGRAYFSRADAESALTLKETSLSAAITRLIKKSKLANPRHGFYLILRPEDQVSGAPDPSNWIAPLMMHQGIDYRISLLRAAAFHGSSHQAAMTFQVIVPVQLRELQLGLHRIQFIYQTPQTFIPVNAPENIGQLKSPAGYSKIAGLELTIFDCVRYFHHAGGISNAAQIVKDLGGKADSRQLAAIAIHYENTSVRRLGFLLERYGHSRQSRSLEPLAKKAQNFVSLDPSVKPMFESFQATSEKNSKWKLMINDIVEVDS